MVLKAKNGVQDAWVQKRGGWKRGRIPLERARKGSLTMAGLRKCLKWDVGCVDVSYSDAKGGRMVTYDETATSGVLNARNQELNVTFGHHSAIRGGDASGSGSLAVRHLCGFFGFCAGGLLFRLR